MRNILIALILLFSSTNALAEIPIVSSDIYNGVNEMPEVTLYSASTVQMSTARVSPFAALAATRRTSKFLQVVSVVNTDTAGHMCLFLATWAQTCAAMTHTCYGAAPHALIVPAGSARTFRFTGKMQVCAVASEADVTGQVERTVMFTR
jgi:hypothetical protein